MIASAQDLYVLVHPQNVLRYFNVCEQHRAQSCTVNFALKELRIP